MPSPETTSDPQSGSRIFYGYYLSAFAFVMGFIVGAIYLYSRGVFVRDQIIDFDASRTEISLVFTSVAVVSTCFAPVLEADELAGHEQHGARGSFTHIEGILQPAPAPRFSRTPPSVRSPPAPAGRGGRQALQDWGMAASEIELREREGVLACD